MAFSTGSLQIFAGPSAYEHIKRNGLNPPDIALMPGAAGGPKGLILHGLDQFIFGEWLVKSSQTVDLVGASIGAWRMAAAMRADSKSALEELSKDYKSQHYTVKEPETRVTPARISEVFKETIAKQFAKSKFEVLNHQRYRLHIVTSRGRHLLNTANRASHGLGYAGLIGSNLLSRKSLSFWMDRVIFSSHQGQMPLRMQDLRTEHQRLTAENFEAALLASCSIPFVLNAVNDIPSAKGFFWDGGVTDYHLHWPFHQLLKRDSKEARFVLYPHFQKEVIPGWFDKKIKNRHHATQNLDNVILLAPKPEWVSNLPNQKLPDRTDFKRYGEDWKKRYAVWSEAVQRADELASDFQRWLSRGCSIQEVKCLLIPRNDASRVLKSTSIYRTY